MRRYHIQDRDDYMRYNKLVGLITRLTNVLRQLDTADPARISMTETLLTKCGAGRVMGKAYDECSGAQGFGGGEMDAQATNMH